MQAILPVQNADREKIMDVLRGFALLGIFIANLHHFSFYNSKNVTGPFHYSFDDIVEFFQGVLIEGKFYSIFSLLFGWGVSQQLYRAEKKGINALPTVRRRLGWMLLLGLMHLFILWTGDIVAFYAMLGFALLLFRKMSDKNLVICGVIFFLLPILLYALKMNFMWMNAPAGIVFETGVTIEKNLMGNSETGRLTGLEKTASWLLIWKQNIAGFFFRYGYLFFVSRIWKVLGVFLIGFMLGRNDNFKKITANKKILTYIILFGFLVALPANLLMSYYMGFEDDYWDLKMNGFYQTVFYAIGVAPLAFAYAAAIILWFRTKTGYKVLSLLQPVGKMAFSNYILQTLVAIIVFYGVGLAKGGQLGPTAWTIFAIAIYMCQIFISYVWLSYFNFGPVEWIWRSLTYKKWQPMKKIR